MKLGVDKAVHVENELMDAYAARGEAEVREASAVFEHMEERNIVAWTIMIALCTRWGNRRAAMRVFRRMIQVSRNKKSAPLRNLKLFLIFF